MPFVASGSGFVWLISVCPVCIASLFIFARIGFELILIVFVARCCVTYYGYLSLDPFCSIVASLKAVKCVKLRAKGRFSYGCVFFIAPFRSVSVRFVFMLRELRISSCVLITP